MTQQRKAKREAAFQKRRVIKSCEEDKGNISGNVERSEMKKVCGEEGNAKSGEAEDVGCGEEGVVCLDLPSATQDWPDYYKIFKF